MKFMKCPPIARILGISVLILAAGLATPQARAAYDLVNLGTNMFTVVEEDATTAAYSQTTNALVFTNAPRLGDTLGGAFTVRDWRHYDSFGVRMTLTGSNPNLPFTVEFFDADFKIINSYQGNTAGVSLTPTVVMLGLSLVGNENFSQVVGMQFTWDGDGAINTSLTEVVGFDAPAAEGFFVVRAPGGMRFLTGTNDTAGLQLTPGGAWSTLSDSNAKTGITAVDHAAVLRQAAELPVTAWSYRNDPGRRHLGPMAQDFHAAFGLGPDNTRITMLDTDGVALSALKGLISELQERKERSAAQAKRLAELEAELLALSERLGGARLSACAE
jgi:hypothetical protein